MGKKDHFNFFNQFEEPYYGVNVNIDCTVAYNNAKKTGASFFLYYLYRSLSAAQQIDAFTLRIQRDEVYRYDRIDAGSTISRPNVTFGFGDFLWYPEFRKFNAEAVNVDIKSSGRRRFTVFSRGKCNSVFIMLWLMGLMLESM